MLRLGPNVTLAATLLLPLGACQNILGFGDEPKSRQPDSGNANGAGGDATSVSTGTSGGSDRASGGAHAGAEQQGQDASSTVGTGPNGVQQGGSHGADSGSGGSSSATSQPAAGGMEGPGSSLAAATIGGTSNASGSPALGPASLGGGAGASSADPSGDAGHSALAMTGDSAGAGGILTQPSEPGTPAKGGQGGTTTTAVGGSGTAGTSGIGGTAGISSFSGNAGKTSVGGTAGSGGVEGTAGAIGAGTVSCTVDMTTLEYDCDGNGPIRVMAIAEGVTLRAGETIQNGTTLTSDWTLPDGMGKVRVDFAGYQELEVEVEVVDPSGYVLDIGDSSTNDGGGGDMGTTSFDAELDVVEHGVGYFPLILYASDLKPGETNALQIANAGAFLAPEDITVRQLWIKDQTVRLDDGQQWTDSALFRVSSLPPPPSDAFVYVGLNRVINDKALWYQVRRVGSGVKKATFHLR